MRFMNLTPSEAGTVAGQVELGPAVVARRAGVWVWAGRRRHETNRKKGAAPSGIIAVAASPCADAEEEDLGREDWNTREKWNAI